jgi:hypothetical protein
MASWVLHVLSVALIVSKTSAAINEELSKMLYDIPAMPGMVAERWEEYAECKLGSGIKEHTSLIVFRNTSDINIPASKIIEFYDRHFESKGFIKWGNSEDLSGRYQGPSLVTKGKAYVWSQGHVTYHVPEKGDFIVFWIHQSRSTETTDSEDTIAKLIDAFSSVSNKFGYKFEVGRDYFTSDITEYLKNECFVERIFCFVKYKETKRSCVGDDGNYSFHLLVFPEHKYALQWKNTILENVKKSEPVFNYYEHRGLGFAPIVIDNIVVNYSGDIFDESNPALREELIQALGCLFHQSQ